MVMSLSCGGVGLPQMLWVSIPSQCFAIRKISLIQEQKTNHEKWGGVTYYTDMERKMKGISVASEVGYGVSQLFLVSGALVRRSTKITII